MIRAQSRKRSMRLCPLHAAALLLCLMPRTGRTLINSRRRCMHSVKALRNLTACKPDYRSTNIAKTGSVAYSQRNMPACSMCSCPELPPGACPCHLAAHPITFARLLSGRQALGSVQCHGGCRSGIASGALRISHRHDQLHHLGGGAIPHHTMAQATHALAQGLDAVMAGPLASSAASVARLGPLGFLVLQLIIGGALLTALAHEMFAVVLGWQLPWGGSGRRNPALPK